LQDDDLSESHIHGFPAPVVKAMVRYFYYHTLDISSPPLPVDRLIFSLQLGLASMMYGVKHLHELTQEFAFEPLKDPEVYIAALRQTCDMASVDSLEEGFNTAIRMMVQMSIVRHLPAFMIRESFRSLLEERSDILSQMLPMILLPKDLPAAGVTGWTNINMEDRLPRKLSRRKRRNGRFRALAVEAFHMIIQSLAGHVERAHDVGRQHS
jgi:hypothetical protein